MWWLWICEQRASVAQAKRHIHSHTPKAAGLDAASGNVSASSRKPIPPPALIRASHALFRFVAILAPILLAANTVTACPKCLAVSTVRHRGGSELSDLIEQARGDPRRSVVSIDEDRKAAQPVFIYHVDHLG